MSELTGKIAVMDQLPQGDVPARSPLYRQAGQAAPADGTTHGVYLWEEGLHSHLILRGNADDQAFGDGVQKATGMTLPTALQSATNGEWSLGWLAPDEWLLTGPGEQAFEMETKLRESLSGHYSVVNVSGGQTLLRLSGPEAVSVLMKSCSYDVHEANFPPGRSSPRYSPNRRRFCGAWMAAVGTGGAPQLRRLHLALAGGSGARIRRVHRCAANPRRSLPKADGRTHMVPKEKLWILTAQCPSRLGTVDVVTRSLAETRNYVVAIELLRRPGHRELQHPGGVAPARRRGIIDPVSGVVRIARRGIRHAMGADRAGSPHARRHPGVQVRPTA